MHLMANEIKTTCPYCGVGCGVVVTRDMQGKLSVYGDTEHPANYGRLCSKGSALADTLDLDGRLLRPKVNGKHCDWHNAISHVSNSFSSIISKYGPDAVAFYVSGQLLTEDYYVANKLMKGFIGSANIDTNSRLCMSSSVAGHKRAFGADTVPCCYEDIELCDMLVLTGSNMAWCHPVLYQRIVKAKKEKPGLFVVVIDPRSTASCDIADLHLPVRSGTDAYLFNGLFSFLNENGNGNQVFINHCTSGFSDTLACAQVSSDSLQDVAAMCDIPVTSLDLFFNKFADNERVVTVYSQGINQSSSGADKVNAIINCHLLTGRIGRPGMGPFSFTGQPNAMGGREVGGLSNQLAAHMVLENQSHRELVQSFWSSPAIADKPGLKAVELFDSIHEGKVKALWVMGTNPAVSLPNTNRVKQALERCEFLVVSDCMENTDPAQFAQVPLPAATWGEKSGTVTNSERRISRQRQFMEMPGDAKPDWWIICEVARAMGYESEFNYKSGCEIFREHADLSGYQNNGSRNFDISALADLSEAEYDSLKPVQWPVIASVMKVDNAKTYTGTARLFTDGRFFGEQGKAVFVPVVPRKPEHPTSDEFPLILNTGRIRDQWHTMTRTGKSATLNRHDPEPVMTIAAFDAAKLGIKNDSLALVRSRWGQVIVKAKVSPEQTLGSIFIPIHWNAQFASCAGVGAVINPAIDPVSGQPEFKHTPVMVEHYGTQWQGFILSRRELTLGKSCFWVKSFGGSYWFYSIAGDSAGSDWGAWARQLLCQSDHEVNWAEYFDGKNNYRAARFVANRVESCAFISSSTQLPAHQWIASLFDKEEVELRERNTLLSGKPPPGTREPGNVVCACFSVDDVTIMQGIKESDLNSVETIGEQLKAGTNCGSCIPELKNILAQCAK